MWLLIKKWWLLQNLDREITRHSIQSEIHELAQGQKVLLTRQFFIVGTESYPGIANKFAGRFNLPCRKFSPDKLKKKIHKYNILFDSCVDDGYIAMTQTPSGASMPIITNSAYKIHGFAGLIQLLGQQFSNLWYLVGVLVAFFVGKYWDNFVSYILKR